MSDIPVIPLLMILVGCTGMALVFAWALTPTPPKDNHDA